MRLQSTVLFRHAQSETAEFPQAVDDRIGNHGILAVDRFGQWRHAFVRELAEGFADHRLFLVEVIRRHASVSVTPRLAQGAHMIRRQVSIRDLHVVIREFGGAKSVGAWPQSQPVLQVAGRFGAERQRQRLLECPLVWRRVPRGIVEHDFGGSEFGTGERQIVEFDLCFFMQTGRRDLERAARTCHDIPRALASVHS